MQSGMLGLPESGSGSRVPRLSGDTPRSAGKLSGTADLGVDLVDGHGARAGVEAAGVRVPARAARHEDLQDLGLIGAATGEERELSVAVTTNRRTASENFVVDAT